MESSYLAIALRIAIIVAGCFFANHILQKILHRLNTRESLPASLYFALSGIIKWIFVVLAIFLVFHQLGVPLSRILTSLSAILVFFAIGFVAAWSILSNILSSLILLIFPPFRFGDTIEIRDPDKEKGFMGKVIGLNIFYTTLQNSADDGNNSTLVRIPNNMFFQKIIICHEGTATKKLEIMINVDQKNGNF